MNSKSFMEAKEGLISIINANLVLIDLTNDERSILIHLKKILVTNYSFENRLRVKGILAHAVVDSQVLDLKLGEKFIMFDNHIN